MSRLLTRDELAGMFEGCGWEEIIYEASPEEGIPETRGLERVAWVGGYHASAESGTGTKAGMLDHYGRRDGMRVWLGEEPPTEAEMAAAPWNEP